MRRKAAQAESKASVNIPKIRELMINHKRYAWSPEWHQPQVQDFAPKDPKILGKLGLKKGEKVLCVAAGHGDWANELAVQGADVVVSDFSPEMLNHVKKKFGKVQFRRFSKSDALVSPTLPQKHDWSFYFEPVPLYNKSLPISLMRSLTNNKGLILVSRPDIARPKLHDIISDTYGVKVTSARTSFSGSLRHESPEVSSRPLDVVTWRTNPKAQRKARIDTSVLRWLASGDRSFSSLKKRLKAANIELSDQELRESLKRIDKLSSTINKFYVQKVDVEP